MDLAHPVQSVIPGAHGAVLGVLARTTEPLSGRRVAELTQQAFGQSRVNEVLGELAEAGIALRESRPPGQTCTCSTGIMSLPKALRRWVSMWVTLLERMRAELETWSTPVVAAWLFG